MWAVHAEPSAPIRGKFRDELGDVFRRAEIGFRRPGALVTVVAQESIVLFDGICNLCNASVRTIAANDPRSRFRFASLESETAKELAVRFGRPSGFGNSIVLVDASGWHERSDAALRIACELAFPWPLLGVFFALPVKLRDRAYDWVARNRYRWFGTA